MSCGTGIAEWLNTIRLLHCTVLRYILTVMSMPVLQQCAHTEPSLCAVETLNPAGC